MSHTITSRELVLTIIPRLHEAEKSVAMRLGATIQFCRDPKEKRRYQEIKSAFELEILMIRLNLDRISERHPDIIDAARQPDAENDYVIDLSNDESLAVERARNLLDRIQRIAV